jgi:hypothetical protein
MEKLGGAGYASIKRALLAAPGSAYLAHRGPPGWLPSEDMPFTDPVIKDALAFVADVDAVGAERLRSKLHQFLDGKTEAAFVADLRRAEAPGWFWQGSWKRAARAWMLVKLVGEHLNGYFDPPDPGTMAGYLATLQQRPEDLLVQDISGSGLVRSPLATLANAPESAARNAWDPDQFTNPRAHQEGAFRYLVHAMRPEADVWQEGGDARQRAYLVENLAGYLIVPEGPGPLKLRSAALYFSDPTKIQGELLSCSVISARNPRTYRDFCFGFVLRAPRKNVAAASAGDMAVSNAVARGDMLAKEFSVAARLVQVDSFLETLLGMYTVAIPSPGELEESSRGHNEVLVVGSLPGSTVTVSAIWVKTMPNGKLWKSFTDAAAEHDLGRHIGQCARTHGLPIVNVPDPRGASSGADFRDWRAHVTTDPALLPRLRIGARVRIVDPPTEAPLATGTIDWEGGGRVSVQFDEVLAPAHALFQNGWWRQGLKFYKSDPSLVVAD